MSQHFRYHIVFKGEIVQGADLDSVKERFRERFNLSDDRLTRLFSGEPVMLKRSLDEEAARRFVSGFRKMGARCRVKKVDVAHEAPPPPSRDLWKGMMGRQPRVETAVEKNQEPAASPAPVEPDPAEALRRAQAILRQSLVPEGHKPELTVKPFSAREFLLPNLITMLLTFFVVGVFTGPDRIFGFLARRVEIHGKALKFHSLWTFAIALGTAVLGGLLFISVFRTFWYLLQYSLLGLTLFIIPLVLLPVPLGLAMMALIQSLTKNTRLDGFAVFKPLYNHTFNEILEFIRLHLAVIYRWGLAMMAGVFGLAPVTWASLVKEWFSRLEVGGYDYQVDIDWGKTVMWSVANFFCMGLLIFKFTAILFNDMLPRGQWIPGDPLYGQPKQGDSA